MKHDELAFLNRQLAGMLQSGIPLEGGLKQLCATMRRGPLRDELDQLEADLANGVPLRDAIAKRRLPDLYVSMVSMAAQGGDLPGTLTLLADYYERQHSLWAKLKALLVYPAIVLLAMVALSGLFAWFYYNVLGQIWGDIFLGMRLPTMLPVAIWAPLFCVLLLAALFVLALAVPGCRRWLEWRLPGFRESNLSLLATALRLFLRAGGRLDQAIALCSEMEKHRPVGEDLRRWHERLAAGQGKFTEFAADSKVVPGLFIWLVGEGGEDPVKGLGHAAEIYYERAKHRIEMMLYAALPVAVMVLGCVIFVQVFCMVRLVAGGMDALGGG